MPGMSPGLSAGNATVIAAFKATLVHQALIALTILAVVAIAWQAAHLYELRRVAAGTSAGGAPAGAAAALFGPEAPARRLLRVSFAFLWIFDGVLQAQPDMPLGMTTGVVRPAAASSPLWVQHLVDAGATIWTFHPVDVPAAAVWIQVGIGLWLLVAARGNWSRLAGIAALGWGLVVWVFGEAFGGIFAPGAAWVFGAPGAVLFYALAGILVALPERHWTRPALGRLLLGAIGAFLVGMALLQAWPGRGFWQGEYRGGRLGQLSTMARTMAGTPQPHALASWLAAFSAFDAGHGFLVNLFVVLVLAGCGVAFIAGRRRFLVYALGLYWVLALAVWVLVQDLGFLGGVGTDPNSMIPIALVVTGAYVAVTRVPAGDAALAPVRSLSAARPPKERFTAWWHSVGRSPAHVLRSTASLGAVAIVFLGAAPMALAAMNPNADAIVTRAANGARDAANDVAKDFHLQDQYGRPVSMSSLRGKTVAMTFLDPVCTNDCPLIGQDFRLADALLAPSLRTRVDMVAVVANPLYRRRSYLVAFDKQEKLTRVRNWLYLTGSLRALERTWRTFGVQVQHEPGGAMVGHSEIAYVIDPHGHVRSVLEVAPATGSAADNSSFAIMLATEIESVAGR